MRPSCFLRPTVLAGCAASTLSLLGCGGSDQNYPTTTLIPPEAPVVSDFSPERGPWGTTVTIQGEWLGSLARSGVELVVGGEGTFVLEPDSDEVLSWFETRIEVRVPFPFEGPVSIETPEGAALAGDFTPSWTPGSSLAAGPATTVVASLSPGAGRIAVLVDAGTPHVLEFDAEKVVEHAIDDTGADLSNAALYLSDAGKIEAIAISAGASKELIQLASSAGGLKAQPTAISGDWEEVLLAGGADGGFAWMRDAAGWTRASSKGGSWSVDRGPLADPAPTDGLRAAGATNDGALHVAWNVPTGSLFDDMEAPTMVTLAPGAPNFSAPMIAGSSLDDFLTLLEIDSRGAGLRLHYCGSDVDPVLQTPPEESCRYDNRTSSGIGGPVELHEDEYTRYVYTESLVGAGHCTDAGLSMVVDASSGEGEVAIWPCPRLLALEIDEDGYFLPVVLHGSKLWSPRVRSE